MAPITFRFISPLTWCHRRSITPSWNLSTIVSLSSSTFWPLPGYQLNSWWETPFLPLDDLCYHRQHSCFPFNTNLFLFCVVPWVPCYPTYVTFYRGVLPSFISRMSWGLLHLLRILGIVTLLTITILFLVPVLFLIGIPTNGMWCVNSKLLATLLLWSYWSIVSFYVYGLLNHHSNIDRAT